MPGKIGYVTINKIQLPQISLLNNIQTAHAGNQFKSYRRQ